MDLWQDGVRLYLKLKKKSLKLVMSGLLFRARKKVKGE